MINFQIYWASLEAGEAKIDEEVSTVFVQQATKARAEFVKRSTGASENKHREVVEATRWVFFFLICAAIV